MSALRVSLLTVMLGVLPALAANAEDTQIGTVKSVEGKVVIERADNKLAAEMGAALFQSDVVRTGASGLVGMTFTDDSRISLGPESELSLETYKFSEGKGTFDSRLNRGLMTAASGRIAKTPMAMRVLVPTGVLGVRGTEFAIRVDE